MLRKIFFTLGGVLVWSIALTTLADTAATTSYTPLAPLPIGADGATTTYAGIGQYLSGVLKLIIALGAIGTILVLVIGGTRYVAASISPHEKENAKHQIQNAIVGFALVLTSYLILNSINPKLVQFDLNLTKALGRHNSLKVAEGPSAYDTAGNKLANHANGTPILNWEDDGPERAKLQALSSKVSINHTRGCGYIGEKNCTSLQGIKDEVLKDLTTIRNSCGISVLGCLVEITGGTEYWLHGNRSPNLASNNTDHRPTDDSGQYGRVVDIKRNEALLEYLKKEVAAGRATNVAGNDCVGLTASRDGQLGRYKVTIESRSILFVDENIKDNPPHFHVCWTF